MILSHSSSSKPQIANYKLFFSIVLIIYIISLSSCSKKSTSEEVAENTNHAEAKLDYNKDVQPILSNYCYHCHGPDTSTRMPKSNPLRLDLRDQALAYENENGVRTIVPGKPDESELVRRIESHDPDLMMPQDKDKLLDAEQIALLRRWIEEGAEFRDHWAFETPVKAELPEVSNSEWVKNEVDHFVLAKLDEKGLKPNEEADRETLIRRVTLDLTGLLPTPEEVDAFVTDKEGNDEAYTKVVDRLLTSPSYGEHRARYWMDYARYGDTHGIHVDAYRGIWPYRDYVINSFNEDKPFDRFTKEQLAGDLLPDGDLNSVVATGFIRAGLVSGEGGSVPQELWVNNKRERVEAFGATYMGLTTGCAVCHDHKYDPLSQKDLFSLTAYFGNVDEKPYHNDKNNWEPYQPIPQGEAKIAYNALLKKRVAMDGKVQDMYKNSDTAVKKWLADITKVSEVDRKDLVTHLPLDGVMEGQKKNEDVNAENPHNKSGGNKGGSIYDAVTGKMHKFEGAPPLWDEYPLIDGTMRMDNNTRFLLPEVGDFEKDQPFTVSTWMRWNEEPLGEGSKTGTILSRMDAKALRGWDLHLTNNKIGFHMISSWDKDVALVFSKSNIPRVKWVHITASYDGSGKAAGMKIYFNGKPVGTDVKKDSLQGSIKNSAPFNLARRGGPDATASPLRGTGFRDLRIYKKALSAGEVAKLPFIDPLARLFNKKKGYVVRDIEQSEEKFSKSQWNPFQVQAARDTYFAQNPEMLTLRAQRATIQKQMDAISAKVPIKNYKGANDINVGKALSADLVKMYNGELSTGTLVCREKPTPAFAHVLSRGDYGARLERVYASTPSFLPPPPKGAPANRLGLAEWVIMKENPLTARVFVNRAWQELFGTGLVESSEDFGIVGDRPTHPKLLDYLAADFRDGDGENTAWKMKRLYKKMVMSMAYRQSAKVSPKAQELDRLNRFYARAPRFRMDAEVLRDTALQSAGLLNQDKTGGPSFLGYQPKGIWSNSYRPNTHLYIQHKAPMIYRKSLYQFVKRTAAHPELTIFDGTDRLIACVRRNRTNTPLAALALLNDVTFLESARNLGTNAMQMDGDINAKLNFMSQRVLSRNFTAEEEASYTYLLAKVRADLNAENATKLLQQGESPQSIGTDPIETAAWMSLASVLLNTDEFLNK